MTDLFRSRTTIQDLVIQISGTEEDESAKPH